MTAFGGFLDLRDELRTAPIGGGGARTCVALAASLDSALSDLAGDVTDRGVAILATGGYGRREQCIYSDVDVTILHDGADPDELARQIFYPLWDAGLKVGHAFRTVGESNAAGKERFDDLTAQLSARLVTGDPLLFESFLNGLRKNLSRSSFTAELGSMEADRRLRHPYQVMAPDVKNGRGALRTFHGFWWERRRAQILGLDFDAETPEEREAFDALLAIRNGLHARAGRPHDTFAFDVREPVAEWLSSDVFSVTARLTSALAVGDRLAEQRWPGVLSPQRRTQARVLTRMRRKKAPEGGVLESTVRLLDQPEDIAQLVDPAAGTGDWTEVERRSFLDLIGSGHRGRVAFVQLQEAGWVKSAFPEWEPVIALPQLAPFHEHPADAHLWRTADEMVALLDTDDPFKSEIVASLGADDDLVLSAFLHDIGKGRGGDHSELGARAAEQFLSRAGFGAASVQTVAKAIRQHLLLIRTATRRDIASLDVVNEVSSALGDTRLLQMLYLLTIADNRATGEHMWSDWKETLLTQLYMRVAEQMTGTATASRISPAHVAELTEESVADDVVAQHLDGLPSDYRDVMAPVDIAWHLDAVEALSERTSLTVDRSGHRVLAVGRDRRGFLLAVCQAFAAHGIGIRDARVYTRSDGIAIDTFDVYQDVGHGEVPGAKWAEVARTLEQIEAGDLDVADRIRYRARTYATQPRSDVSVVVREDLSNGDLAIEIRATDRIGLLADLIAALYGEDLDLRLARIDTRADEAIDVLYVSRESAPTSDADLAKMCSRIAAGIEIDAG